MDLPDTADLLRVSDAYDRTPAHDAAEHGHVICLKLLMEAGMSLYLPDKVSSLVDYIPAHCNIYLVLN